MQFHILPVKLRVQCICTERTHTLTPEGVDLKGGHLMSRSIYELQGFAIVLDKVALVSRVFTAENDEGYQFNITFSTDLRLPVKFPTRTDADLERQLVLKALKSD
jgi:hypothetical protein